MGFTKKALPSAKRQKTTDSTKRSLKWARLHSKSTFSAARMEEPIDADWWKDEISVMLHLGFTDNPEGHEAWTAWSKSDVVVPQLRVLKMHYGQRHWPSPLHSAEDFQWLQNQFDLQNDSLLSVDIFDETIPVKPIVSDLKQKFPFAWALMVSVFKVYKENEEAENPASILDEQNAPRWYSIWAAIRYVRRRLWEDLEIQATGEEKETIPRKNRLEHRPSTSGIKESSKDYDLPMSVKSEQPSSTLDHHDAQPAAKHVSVIFALSNRVFLEANSNEQQLIQDQRRLQGIQRQVEGVERNTAELERNIADMKFRLAEDSHLKARLDEEAGVREEEITNRLQKRKRFDTCKQDIVRLDAMKKKFADGLRDMGIDSWREDADASLSGPTKKLRLKYPDVFPDDDA